MLGCFVGGEKKIAKIVRLMFLYHITDKISHTCKYSRHLGSAMDV